MAVKAQKMMTELFDQAVESFDAAMKTGVKLQEDATKWWSDVLGDAGSLQEWQKRANLVVTEAIPTAQKNAEECLRVIEQTSRNGLDLLKKTFDAGQVESLAEAQQKLQGLWEATLTTLRTNAQALVQANAKAMESWAAFAKKSTNGSGQPAAK